LSFAKVPEEKISTDIGKGRLFGIRSEATIRIEVRGLDRGKESGPGIVARESGTDVP